MQSSNSNQSLRSADEDEDEEEGKVQGLFRGRVRSNEVFHAMESHRDLVSRAFRA